MNCFSPYDDEVCLPIVTLLPPTSLGYCSKSEFTFTLMKLIVDVRLFCLNAFGL